VPPRGCPKYPDAFTLTPDRDAMDKSELQSHPERASSYRKTSCFERPTKSNPNSKVQPKLEKKKREQPRISSSSVTTWTEKLKYFFFTRIRGTEAPSCFSFSTRRTGAWRSRGAAAEPTASFSKPEVETTSKLPAWRAGGFQPRVSTWSACAGGGGGSGGAAKGRLRSMRKRMRRGKGAPWSSCSSTRATSTVYSSISSATIATRIIISGSRPAGEW
jgi:hypothetical protein